MPIAFPTFLLIMASSTCNCITYYRGIYRLSFKWVEHCRRLSLPQQLVWPLPYDLWLSLFPFCFVFFSFLVHLFPVLCDCTCSFLTFSPPFPTWGVFFICLTQTQNYSCNLFLWNVNLGWCALLLVMCCHKFKFILSLNHLDSVYCWSMKEKKINSGFHSYCHSIQQCFYSISICRDGPKKGLGWVGEVIRVAIMVVVYVLYTLATKNWFASPKRKSCTWLLDLTSWVLAFYALGLMACWGWEDKN